jgi:AcrR family transcriptional regulator
MAPSDAPTRNRILDASAALFRERGYAATGMKEIARQADAPFGSIYHFFPGGKSHLAAEVIRQEGVRYLDLIDSLFADRQDLAKALIDAFAGAAEVLASLDFVDVCPIATLALEVASTDEALRIATAQVFQAWQSRLASHFRAFGLDEASAASLAETAICALEGGFMLARSRKDASVLRRLGQQMARLAPGV